MTDKTERPSAKALTKSYLNEVVEQAGRKLRGWMLCQAASSAIERGLAVLLIVPAVVVIGQLVLPDSESWLPGFWPMVALSLGAALVYVSTHLIWVAATTPTPRQIALSLYDRQLKLKDRLTAADQFLDDEAQGPFYAAAIEDAREFAKFAAGAEIEKVKKRFRPVRRRTLFYIPGCVMAILLSTWLGHGGDFIWHTEPPSSADIVLPSEIVSVAAPGQRQSGRAERSAGSSSEETESKPASPVESTVSGGAQEKANSVASGGTMKKAFPNSNSASGGASSGGAPVESGEPENPSDPTGKQVAKTPQPQQINPDEKGAEQGASLGGATSASTGQNPDRIGIDQQTGQSNSPEDEQQDQHELAEEDEPQEAFASAKPNRHLRKPPTSRSLGFSAPSGKPDEGSNGRGGKSGLKKTRGVPSMILGVPLADRVNGVRSPGFSKIMQEKVAPKTTVISNDIAQFRKSRISSVGDMLQHQPTVDMKALVKTYFLSLRAQFEAGETDEGD